MENELVVCRVCGGIRYHFWMLAHRHLYAGDMDAAMKTALRLADYEDIVEPKAVYSLIALTSLYAKYYGQCSRAFIKLEAMESLSKAERDKYRKLALSVFVRNPPEDPTTRVYPCTKRNCNGQVKDWMSHCPDCNRHFQACVISGRTILSSSGVVTCRGCRHQMYKQEMRGNLANCPLCHSLLQR